MSTFRLFLFLKLFFSVILVASPMNWRVVDQYGDAVGSATVTLLKARSVLITDLKGQFFLPENISFPDTLFLEKEGFTSLRMNITHQFADGHEVQLIRNVFHLPPIEVWAKGNKGNRLIPGKTSVIEMEKWQFANSASISETFKYQPELQIQEYGTGGSLKTLNINGFNSSHIAFRIEGMPINSMQNGGVDLSLLNAGSVNSVKINFGSNAIDAGSSAMGGMVNISLIPENIGKRLFVKTALGSFENRSINFIVEHADSSSYGFIVNGSYRAGTDDYTFSQFEDEKVVYNGAFNRKQLLFGGRLKTGKQAALKLYALFTRAESGIPDTSPYNISRQKEDGEIVGLNFRTDLGYNNLLNIDAGYQLSDQTYENNNLGIEDHYSNQTLFLNTSFFMCDQTAENQLKATGELNYYHLNSTQIIFKDEYNARFVLMARKAIVTDEGSVLMFSAGGGIDYSDYDHQSRFDYHFGLKGLIKSFDIYTTLHSGFKKPTFNDRYWPGQGNDSLRVEESLHWILGFSWSLNRYISLKADYSPYVAKDMIRWIPGNDGLWQPQNVDNIQGQVMSLRIDMEFPMISVVGGITSQRITKENIQLRLVPEMLGSLALYYRPLVGLEIFAATIFEGEKSLTEGPGENIYLSEYAVLDMGISYSLGLFTMRFKMNNITDELYYIQPNFPMKGRNWMVELEVNTGGLH